MLNISKTSPHPFKLIIVKLFKYNCNFWSKEKNNRGKKNKLNERKKGNLIPI